MGKFIVDLFLYPGSQSKPYEWGSVFGAHLAFGMLTWVLAIAVADQIGITQGHKFATQISIITYAIWEFGQFLRRRTIAIFWDCVLDLVAWSSMALAMYEIWEHQSLNAVGYVIGAIIIIMVGVCKRLHRK